jgi:colicin import membrane protein
MRVIMLRTVKGAADGVHSMNYVEGELYDLTSASGRAEELAATFLKMGAAVELTDEEATAQEKKISETKAAIAAKAKADAEAAAVAHAAAKAAAEALVTAEDKAKAEALAAAEAKKRLDATMKKQAYEAKKKAKAEEKSARRKRPEGSSDVIILPAADADTQKPTKDSE